LVTADLCDLFVRCLEDVRHDFGLYVYGYVVMPEHVHLLVSEPSKRRLADAIHDLKLSFARVAKKLMVPQVRARSVGANLGAFWQARYYDRNVRDYEEFKVKLRYLHQNPVKRGLVSKPEDWKWSSYRHYALREIGVVEIESQWTATDREQTACGGLERIFLGLG
jgi:putative transposase